jgi:TolB protein
MEALLQTAEDPSFSLWSHEAVRLLGGKPALGSPAGGPMQRKNQGLAPFPVLALITLLFLAGCTDPALLAQFQQAGVLTPTAGPAVTPVNRLLVQGAGGDLYTVAPDGTDRMALTGDGGARRQYLQPTWSPDGEQIAWTEVDTVGDSSTSAVVVSSFDGASQRRSATPFAPFYYFWSPDGARLAYLSNWQSLSQPSIALRLVDLSDTGVDAAAPIVTLAEGQPLYFSWAPDSTRLLTHIANERIEIQPVEGAAEPLQLSGAGFPAPQWSADGEYHVYALSDAAGQRLVLADVRGGAQQDITDFDDQISFTLSPDGSALAYAVTPAAAGTAAFGPLYVVEMATGRTRELSDTPVLAFFWSPDSRKLAYLALDTERTSFGLRWHVWDGTSTRAYASIVPTRTFLQSYLAFFDQYAQSMRIWSPDSSAFVYAAVAPETGSAIWVQALDASAPAMVGSGVFAAWSPR